MSLKLAFHFTCLFFILFSAFVCPAHGEWWRNKGIKEKLTLSDEQIKHMETIFTVHQKTRVDLQSDVRKAQIELKSLMSQETLEEEKVEQAALLLSTAQQQILQETVRMKLAVRKVLTPEQIKVLLVEDPDIFTIGRRWSGSKRRVVKQGKVIVKEGQPK